MPLGARASPATLGAGLGTLAGMAILHRATLTPTKLELLEVWLDRQPWGGAGALEAVGAYRYDDPQGEVGVEGILVRRGDLLLHVPLSYRGAPLEGADESLVGTTEHSVLGRRWVYSAAGDPVAVGCFERALHGEQEQATLEVHEDGQVVERREPTVRLRLEHGAGGSDELRVVHVLGETSALAHDAATRLVASWDGGEAVVATL